MDLSECVSVCWPVGDLPWPPAACRSLGDLAPDGGGKAPQLAALLCEAGDSFSWGFSVRADVCVWVHKVVAAGRCPKHPMGETAWAKVAHFH